MHGQLSSQKPGTLPHVDQSEAAGFFTTCGRNIGIKSDTVVLHPQSDLRAIESQRHRRLSGVGVFKHANATARAGKVELEVEDNGKGFDPPAVANKGGIGLLSIRQRVQNLDGSLSILSAPGEGTKVKVTIAGG